MLHGKVVQCNQFHTVKNVHVAVYNNKVSLSQIIPRVQKKVQGVLPECAGHWKVSETLPSFIRRERPCSDTNPNPTDGQVCRLDDSITDYREGLEKCLFLAP